MRKIETKTCSFELLEAISSDLKSDEEEVGDARTGGTLGGPHHDGAAEEADRARVTHCLLPRTCLRGRVLPRSLTVVKTKDKINKHIVNKMQHIG